MGCPHGDVLGACLKCARVADATSPPAGRGKNKGRLRVTDHRGLFVCQFCKEVPKFKVVRAWVHKTRLACLGCGKEQNVLVAFSEEDNGDFKRTRLVFNATPRAKYPYSYE